MDNHFPPPPLSFPSCKIAKLAIPQLPKPISTVLMIRTSTKGPSPGDTHGMIDFVLWAARSRAVNEAAQRKRVKYEAKCADIGYGFLLFSFSSFGELEKDAVTLLKRIRKFSMTQDIGTRAAVHIFNRINCETLKEADFPSIGLEDIESLKGGWRNLFDEKSTVQNVNEDDMILQDLLLNIPFLSTQEVACLEIDTQKFAQIQKQEIPKSFHSNKLKLGKYVLPDAQATRKKRQEIMVTETSIFCGKETKTFDSIKSKLVKKNDGMDECMKEKPIHELKGKSIDFKGGHPTVKRQQIKKAIEGEKMFQRRVLKVILDEQVSKEGKKIVEYIWSKKTPEGDKLSSDGNVYCHTVMMTQHSVEMGKDLEARRESFDKNIDIVLKQAKRKNFDDVNLVFLPTIKMLKKSNHFYVICFNLKTSKIDIIDNIDNGIDDIKTRCGGFPCALMESFIDYLERKKYQKCYDLILAEPKLVEFPWKTTYNSHDCGVFVMRHMETYLGKGNFLQEFKKEGPGQKVQLNILHAKYMVKILLMSFNEKKKTLLTSTSIHKDETKEF
ncbi:ulp1 protease family, C-terminal catalytic domain-containing protein [Tanacetum coccineum]